MDGLGESELVIWARASKLGARQKLRGVNKSGSEARLMRSLWLDGTGPGGPTVANPACAGALAGPARAVPGLA